MYGNLLKAQYQVPVDLSQHGNVVKQSLLLNVQTIEAALVHYEAANKAHFDQELQAAQVDLEANKAELLRQLAEQIQQVQWQSEQALQAIESSCNKLVPQVLEYFHSEISDRSRLQFSIKQLLDRYRQQENVLLLVRSYAEFELLAVTLPEGWEVKEDDTLVNDCKLVLESSEVLCDFDAIFFNLVNKMGAIEPSAH